ncbi:MAG: alpha/beta fold hydrolase [bacterium]|nr:alpha/beta fold hydrolase [bacterium]
MDANQTLVMSYFDAFKDKGFNEIEPLLDENIVWHVPGDKIAATAGIGRGKDYVKEWISRFRNNLITQDVQVNKFISHGDDVLVFGSFSHKVVQTGNYFSGDFVTQFTIKNNKIARYQIFEDSALIEKAFDPGHSSRENRVRINSTNYSYTDTGNGPSIIFAHGVFVNREMFNYQAAKLSENYRCINLDLPAHGKTDFPETGWSLDDIAEDIALLIEEKRLGKVTFVGQSQGGMIGMRLAARFPELVENLVLIGTSARAELPEKMPLRTQIKKVLSTGSYLEKEQLFSNVQLATKSKEWVEENKEPALEQKNSMLALSSKGLDLAINAAVLERADCRELLGEIGAKTLILSGVNDEATPKEAAVEMNELIKGSELQLIKGANHHLPIEKPETVLNAIEKFI